MIDRTPSRVLLAGVVAIAMAVAASAAAGQTPQLTCSGLSHDACYARALSLIVDSVPRARTDAAAARIERTADAMFDFVCGAGGGHACFRFGRILQLRAMGQSDTARAAQLERAAAGQHLRGCVAATQSADSCNALGDAFHNGIGRPLLPDSASSYYERGCVGGSALACINAVTRSRNTAGMSDDELAELLRTMNEQACRTGESLRACIDHAFAEDKRLRERGAAELGSALYARERERIRATYRQLCDEGLALACGHLGRLFADGAAPFATDSALTLHFYRRACLGVRGRTATGVELPPTAHGIGCENLGTLFNEGGMLEANRDSALFYFARGCDELYTNSCAAYSMAHPDSSSVEALRLAAVACFEHNGYACAVTGWRLQRVLRDSISALDFLRRGCTLRNPWSCNAVGIQANNSGDTDSAIKYYRTGCDIGYYYSCSNLTGILEDLGLTAAQYAVYNVRACLNAEDDADEVHHEAAAARCWDAVTHMRATGREMEEARYRATACRLAHSYCKRKT
ncbi:MAG TPA: hypothetical protein VMN60_14360 [Longimicrobiales bacterium]|nr:hypothetical protein [Longimicrobiales bacterium]